ncbi:hypothetical protein NXW84_16140 [Bacteroides fragilis]|nr:hypothetical protein NXW84_16140 [Bacteroides fragilis]
MAWVKDMIAAGYEFQPGKTVAKNKIWYGDYIYADSNNNGVYGDDNDYTFQKLPISLNTISVFRPLPHGKDSTSLWYGQELPDSAYIGGATTGYNAASTEWGSTIAQRVAENHYFYNPENPDDPRTNINAKYPRMAYIDGYVQNRHGNTTLWLYKGDYIKLKNLSLGYTLPKNWVSKIAMQNARVYVSAENLLTITGFEGQDPESATGMGYSPFRTIAIGANITF